MTFVLIGLALLAFGAAALDLNTHPFPKDFKFGVSTAAYQIEGGWNEDGKGTSMWDDFVHEHPEKIMKRTNGDIACDSYHFYQQDVELLKEMGAQFYRMSISWPRILPDGTGHQVNEKGVAYYVNLLKLLKDNGIEPIVTLYHWDLPTPLNQMGGWTNPDIVDYFGDYARICFKYFGEYVKYWITLNEPSSTCFGGYGGTGAAPAYSLTAEGLYLCAYTHVKAHARAYHIYQEEFRSKQQGKISLSLVSQWYEAATSSSDDQEAHLLAMEFALGLFAHPIYVGDWPKLVVERVANRSAMEGLPQSRLPSFTQQEIDYIKGTYDYYGLNYYITRLVELQYDEDNLPGNASYIVDEGFKGFPNSSWKKANSTSSWVVQVPWGLTKVLRWVHDNYNQPEIIITENGWSDNGSSLNDTDRIEYVSLHLSSILDAINNYSINVAGYTQWSLMDNFEWGNGYTSKFGVVSVDFDSPNRTRTPKQSFYWYKNVISTRCLMDACSGVPSLTSQAVLVLIAMVLWKFVK